VALGAAELKDTAAAQLRVLQLCAEAGSWRDLTEETARATGRGYVGAVGGASHLMELLGRLAEQAEQGAAEEAVEAAVALRGFAAAAELAEPLDTTEAQQGPSVDAAGAAAAAKREAQAARAARRYSKSIAIASEAPMYAGGDGAEGGGGGGGGEGGASTALRIVYEDDELLAVNKPTDVAVHPRHRFEGGAMLNRAVAYLGRPPYVVHRLDAPTSGLLLFAKTLPAARDLAYQFRMRRLSKKYLAALVHGGGATTGLPSDAFEVDAPIAPHPHDRKLSRCLPHPTLGHDRGDDDALAAAVAAGLAAGGGKRSLTRFETLARGDAATLVAARPLTGRMHQIRVHAEWCGHPIAGDPQYGLAGGAWSSSSSASAAAAADAAPRLMLHAHSLSIRHPDPARGGLLRLTAAPTDDFEASLRALGIDAGATRDLAQEEGVVWLGETDEDGENADEE